MSNAIIKRSQNALKLNFERNGDWILADRSGSMGVQDFGQPRSRIDYLNETLSSYKEGTNIIAFDDRVVKYDGVPLTPGGGTHLEKAITEALKYEPSYVIVISDGQVSDEPTSLALAATLAKTAIIDTLYIGPSDDSRATDFLRKLADIGNGRFREFASSELSKTVQALLPPPSDEPVNL